MYQSPEKQIDLQNHANDQDDQSQDDSQSGSGNQRSHEPMQSLSDEDGSDQQSDSSSPVEAAIKSMKFRKNRGTKMKDLMQGNINRDAFWDKHCRIFGGDLRLREQSDDEEDYEQSSSGRDQFDSDFNNTDSYPGKRGRKKGTKVKKRKLETGRKRGRPKKVKVEKEESQGYSENSKQKPQKPRRGRKPAVKDEKIEVAKPKLIYKRVPEKPQDYFMVMKATIAPKRGRKPKNAVKQDEQPIPQNSE